MPPAGSSWATATIWSSSWATTTSTTRRKARTGATKLIREDGVSFIMMLGGDTWPGVQPVADKTGMLFSTLLPSGPVAPTPPR